MRQRYKLILNNDIDLIATKRFDPSSISDITETREDGFKLEQFNFECINTDNFFSFVNPESLFYNTNITKFTIDYYFDNQALFSTNINKITINESKKTANLECETVIGKALKTNTFCVMEDQNPIDIIYDQLEKLGLNDYLIRSGFDRAKDFFDTTKYFVRLSSYIEPSQQTSVFDYLEQISELLSSNIYITQNKINFQHYNPEQEYIISHSILEREIIEISSIYTDDTKLINDYLIKTEVIDCKDSDNLNIGLTSRNKYGKKEYSFNATSNDTIVIKDGSVGYTLGNLKVGKEKDIRVYVNLTIDKNKVELLKVGEIIGLNYADYKWVDKMFEIISITRKAKMNEPSEVVLKMI